MPNAKILAKVCSKFCQILYKPYKIAKDVKFLRIWSH